VKREKNLLHIFFLSCSSSIADSDSENFFYRVNILSHPYEMKTTRCWMIMTY
jgi:hypothetical protein